jgi:hypothetical protein
MGRTLVARKMRPNSRSARARAWRTSLLAAGSPSTRWHTRASVLSMSSTLAAHCSRAEADYDRMPQAL